MSSPLSHLSHLSSDSTITMIGLTLATLIAAKHNTLEAQAVIAAVKAVKMATVKEVSRTTKGYSFN